MIDHTAQLATLLSDLPPEESKRILETISRFQEYLLEVNQSINLISRQNSEAVLLDLCYDSLAMLRHIPYAAGLRLTDIGSGAGFPWIIHKIVFPDLNIVSIDSNRRKIEFQRSVASKLAFRNCEFRSSRVESVEAINSDFLIAKALGSVQMICDLAAPHLKEGGLLILPRTAMGDSEGIKSPFVLENLAGYESSASGQRSFLLLLRKH